MAVTASTPKAVRPSTWPHATGAWSVGVVEMAAAASCAVARVRGARAAVVAISDELYDAWHPGVGHRSLLLEQGRRSPSG